MTTVIPAPDANNEWRLSTPGSADWERSPRPDASDKYFMVSTDGHAQEPKDLWATRMDDKYQDRLPGVIIGMKGQKFQKTEGFRNPLKLNDIKFEGQDLLRNKAGYTPEGRLADLAADGTDAEIIFPNKGLTMWATSDPDFSHAMCSVYNDWAWETFGPHGDQLIPMACIAPAALDDAIAEIQRCAELGFKGLQLPSKPIWGPPDHEALNYNLKEFDPLWAAICEVDLPVTFHMSTGRDQLCGSLARTKYRANRKSLCFWCRRTISKFTIWQCRGRHWLGPLGNSSNGRGVPETSLGGSPQT